MAPKGQKPTKAELEAGKKNLEKWRSDNPQGGNLKHGAHSDHIKRKYADGRTKEAKQLKAIIQGLVDDLGGHSDLTAAQRLILDNIRSKLIVLIQIGKHVEKHESLINDKGELLPCLGRNYTTYSESLRRDLEALFAVRRKRSPQSYRDALRAIEGGKK
ncbi:MAG: hypothetical protein KAU38_15650 [Desulfobacterales bacterium]|nr:hypothetical protein [Desulfobacterales bacterium]